MRALYVAGESGIANLALVAEESRTRNSLVQQWAPRGVNEDAHALQTVACCDGLPRESLVAFATVILHTLFTCLRVFCVRIRVRGVWRARLTSA